MGRDGRRVYFAQGTPGGLIKIGTSRVPQIRVRALWAPEAGHRGCELLADCDASHDTNVYMLVFRREHELHHRFRADRAVGEWFEPTPALMRLIEHIADREPLAA